jgi:hypothetical protein
MPVGKDGRRQCCGSGMIIPDPDFCPSRISDTRIQATKEKGAKKFVVLSFFVATNITKLKILLYFEQAKKKLWANLQRIMQLFTQNKCH